MARTAPVAGTVDLVGAPAVHAEALTTSLQDVFRRYGCQPVTPPILEHAAPFLDRSGEAIRQRMYMFTDPDGRELCLRPELTIPTAQLYDRRARGTGDQFRGYYIGPVFRFDRPGVGRYRQFTQAGVELLGGEVPEVADAEILAIAVECLTAHGVEPGEVVVSDISLLRALVDDAQLDDRSTSVLHGAASDPDALRTLLDRAAPEGGPDGSYEAETGALIARLPDTVRDELLGRLLGGYSSEELGARTAGEVAQRLVTRSAGLPLKTLPPQLDQALRRLLEVDAPLPDGLEIIAALADERSSPALAERVESWRRRVELIEAFGLDPERITLRLGLRRGIDYYSSFIFEIHDGRQTSVSQVCAGGRYDELVGMLSGREGTPGVGFALGVERLAHLMDAPPADLGTDVVVVRGGDAPLPACVRAATELRQHGLTVRVYESRRVRSAMRLALRDATRFLVIVGEEELGSSAVMVRDLETRQQRPASFGALATTIEEMIRG